MDRQAWRDFFITVFLLGISFVIAMLSSVAAQQNAIRLAAIAAAISLLLAVIGAIYILPRLARRVQIEFVRFAVRTTVTVEGLFFLALLVVIGFAAWNTANNLLYLILSAMIGFLFAANFISRISLADLSIQLRFPDHIFTGETAALSLTVNNNKRFVPTFSITVEPLTEAKSSSGAGGGGRWKSGKPPEPQKPLPGAPAATPAAETIGETQADRKTGTGSWFKRRRARRKDAAGRLLGEQTAGNLGKLAHFILVPPGASAKQRIEHKFESRGCYPITAFRVSTKFPTGFFKKWRRIEAAGEIVVYPKPKPLDDFYHALPMIAGQVSSPARGSGDDLYRIRQYHPSDHMRHIDWKATAKARILMTRDYTREDERRLTIVFDTSRPAPGSLSRAGETDPRSAENPSGEEKQKEGWFERGFESAVVMAASLANHFILEGSDVELITARSSTSVGSSTGVDHLYNVLRALAVLQPEGDEPGKPTEMGKRSGGEAAGQDAKAATNTTARSFARGRLNSSPARAAAKARDGDVAARNLWQMLGEIPILGDERRFKVLITSSRKGTIPASIWRSAHVVFMEDLL
jgi:uncharacterized protein (DUF58 family)